MCTPRPYCLDVVQKIYQNSFLLRRLPRADFGYDTKLVWTRVRHVLVVNLPLESDLRSTSSLVRLPLRGRIRTIASMASRSTQPMRATSTFCSILRVASCICSQSCRLRCCLLLSVLTSQNTALYQNPPLARKKYNDLVVSSFFELWQRRRRRREERNKETRTGIEKPEAGKLAQHIWHPILLTLDGDIVPLFVTNHKPRVVRNVRKTTSQETY